MKFSDNQRGSSHLVLLVALAVVVIVGVVGYRVVNNPSDTDSSTSISSSSTQEPDQIKSTADVKKASKALDNTAVDSSVNPNQLDDDLDSLL